MRLVAASILLIAVLGGCMPIEEIRSIYKPADMPPAQIRTDLGDCHAGTGVQRTSDADPEFRRTQSAIEDYGTHLVTYAEFDDQGWPVNGRKSSAQADEILNTLEREVAKQPITIMVFVHGWHHNAYSDDCAVGEFRTLIAMASEEFKRREPSRQRKVIGIYVAWRGESVPVPGIRQLTIYTRKLTAERVAKGSVRELFARLRIFETTHREHRSESVRTVVIGHSFGGLIAFHSLSQGLIEEIVNAKQRNCGASASSTVASAAYPDLVVLINPAFEATRYEPLFQATQLEGGCKWPERKRPRVLTLAADNDQATGRFFPISRQIVTMFEQYNPSYNGADRDANLNVIGFVDRYRTHRICRGRGGKVVLQEDKAHLKTDFNSPLWVLRAPPDVLDGHDGFLYSRTTGNLSHLLFDFVVALYAAGKDEVIGECHEKPA